MLIVACCEDVGGLAGVHSYSLWQPPGQVQFPFVLEFRIVVFGEFKAHGTAPPRTSATVRR